MKSGKNKGKKKYIVALLVLAFLLIAILVTGYQIKSAQDIRSRAAQYINGTYYCSGCSNNYDRAFARWESTSADCLGVKLETVMYSPSCNCRAPGKPSYPNAPADACSGPTYMCSGCDKYLYGHFSEWLAIYPDCPGGSATGKNVTYDIEDAHCSAFAGQRPTPTPTPTPASQTGTCTLTIPDNSPCYTTGYFSGGTCGVKVSWTSNGDVQLYYQNPELLAFTAEYRNLNFDGTPYAPIDTSHWIGNGSIFVPVSYQSGSPWGLPLTFICVMNGTIKDKKVLSSVRVTNGPPDPALPPLAAECQYTETNVGGVVVRTPVCPISNSGPAIVPRGGTNIPNKCTQCPAGQVLCALSIDVCGCVGRYSCLSADACTGGYKGTIANTQGCRNAGTQTGAPSGFNSGNSPLYQFFQRFMQSGGARSGFQQ